MPRSATASTDTLRVSDHPPPSDPPDTSPRMQSRRPTPHREPLDRRPSEEMTIAGVADIAAMDKSGTTPVSAHRAIRRSLAVRSLCITGSSFLDSAIVSISCAFPRTPYVRVSGLLPFRRPKHRSGILRWPGRSGVAPRHPWLIYPARPAALRFLLRLRTGRHFLCRRSPAWGSSLHSPCDGESEARWRANPPRLS